MAYKQTHTILLLAGVPRTSASIQMMGKFLDKSLVQRGDRRTL
jgi:hypothetical protein